MFSWSNLLETDRFVERNGEKGSVDLDLRRAGATRDGFSRGEEGAPNAVSDRVTAHVDGDAVTAVHDAITGEAQDTLVHCDE